MESLYSKFYSGGENLKKRNVYPNKKLLSYSSSQPIIHLKDYINGDQNNGNNKLKLLENKIYDLENENIRRKNILMSEMYKKMNYHNQNRNNDYNINDDIVIRNKNNIKEKPIILPPIPLYSSSSLGNYFSKKKWKKKKKKRKNEIIIRNNEINDYFNKLNDKLTNKIYDENFKAIKSIDHLKNDYKNVSIILENKIDQMQYIQQINYEILKNLLNNQNNQNNDNSKIKRTRTRRSNSTENGHDKKYLEHLINIILNERLKKQNKTEDSNNLITEDELRLIIKNQIKKRLELRKLQELEKLRNQRKIENIIDHQLNFNLINEMEKENKNKNSMLQNNIPVQNIIPIENNIPIQNNIPIENNIPLHNNSQQTESDNNINNNNENDTEPKIIEKIYPLILDDNEIDHYIEGIKKKRDKGLLIEQEENEITGDSKKKKKIIRLKKSKKNKDFDNIEENEESNESEDETPKAKFLIRGKNEK